MSGSGRLSLNQATVKRWTAREAIEGCARHGIGHIGLWREPVQELGIEATVALLRDTGVRASSLCRGGFFPAPTRAERDRRHEENLRAVDEAAALTADVLVLVCGGVVDRDAAASRQMIEDGIRALEPHARSSGVRLGIEPLHPMFAADRSVVCDLGEAVELAERIDSWAVGVVIDVYHVWWDHEVLDHVRRSRGRIVGFHVNDWITPPPDVLLGRGMMGDGCIDLHGLQAAVHAAGYDGPIEVEIFNRELWDRPGDDVLALTRQRFEEHVLRVRGDAAGG